MEVDMSKKKDTHTHTRFAELSHMSVGKCMYQIWAIQLRSWVLKIGMELEWSDALLGWSRSGIFKIEMEVEWS